MLDDAPTIVAGTRSSRRLRFSLLTLLIFITVVSIALAWLVQKRRVTATALFVVRSAEPSVFGEKTSQSFNAADFDILKKTQLALLKSEFVLQSAVRNPAVAGLALFPPKTDQVAWLQEHLECDFVENGEILSIKLRGTEPQSNDLVAVVDAVAAAYEKEGLIAEKARQLAQRDMLERSLQNLRSEIVRKYEDYFDIVKGMPAQGNRGVQQQLELKRLERVEDEITQLERDLLRNENSGDAKEIKFMQERIAQLQKRRTEMEKKIRAMWEESAALIIRKQELDQLQPITHDMAIKLQEMDLEASAPARIYKVQPAVITHGD